MSATIEQVTQVALTLPVSEQARLAQALLANVESATTPSNATSQSLAKRREVMQKFVSGDRGAELIGYEEARASDRAAASEQARARVDE